METYEVLFDPKKNDGVYAISLVEDPAIEQQFIALSKQYEVKLATVNEEKRIVVGPVLIPGQLILRRDDAGNEFNIMFPDQTIKMIHQNFVSNGYQNNSTIEHDGNPIKDVCFVESWIKEDDVHDKSVLYGFNQPVGTMFAMQKINNDTVWNDYVKTGKVKGFSIDGVFDLQKINLKREYMNENLGTQIADAIKKGFAAILSAAQEPPAEITQEEVSLTQATLEDGTTIVEAESFEVGKTVQIVAADGTKSPAPEGEHKLQDGTTIVVDANGVITEVKPAEAMTEVETEMSAEDKFGEMLKTAITSIATEFGVQLQKVKTELKAEIAEAKNLKVELSAETKPKPEQKQNQPTTAFEKFRQRTFKN